LRGDTIPLRRAFDLSKSESTQNARSGGRSHSVPLSVSLSLECAASRWKRSRAAAVVLCTDIFTCLFFLLLIFDFRFSILDYVVVSKGCDTKQCSPIPPLSTLTSRATHAHPTSPRSTGFCDIWDCISSSSSSSSHIGVYFALSDGLSNRVNLTRHLTLPQSL